MMNDYLLFICYNLITFIVSMVIWNLLPKSKPYDYTTIPGPALSDDEEIRDMRLAEGCEGHVRQINKSSSLTTFLDTLHLQHGPISSFYLKHIYVVSLRSKEYISQLYKCAHQLIRDDDIKYELEKYLAQLEFQVEPMKCRFVPNLGNIMCINDQNAGCIGIAFFGLEIDLSGYPVPSKVYHVILAGIGFYAQDEPISHYQKHLCHLPSCRTGGAKAHMLNMKSSTNPINTDNVYIFVPNLIGYVRILFSIISCIFMPSHYVLAGVFYFLSAFMDAIDGYAARYLNQSSRFGAMLDQLTDRMSLLCLHFALCVFYPQYIFFIQMSAVIDIASHWLHLHSTDLIGSESHKKVDETGNAILKLYYTSRPFLFFMCMINECFFSMLYVAHFTSGPLIPLLNVGLVPFLAVVCLPGALIKAAISVVHLVSAADTVVQYDIKRREKID